MEEDIRKLLETLKSVEEKLVSIENASSAMYYQVWSLAVVLFLIIGVLLFDKIPGYIQGYFSIAYWIVATALIIKLYVEAEKKLTTFYMNLSKKYGSEFITNIAKMRRKVIRIIGLGWLTSFTLGYAIAYVLHVFFGIKFYMLFTIGYLSAIAMGNILLFIVHYIYYRVVDYIPAYIATILVVAIPLSFIVSESFIMVYSLGSLVLAYEVATLLYLRRAIKVSL